MKSFRLLEKLLIELEANTSVALSTEYITTRIQDVFIQLKKDKASSITWTVGDFESRARDLELDAKDFPEELHQKYLDAKKMPQELRMFNRKKFREALHKMIQEHDASRGISWNTVDSFLHRECSLT